MMLHNFLSRCVLLFRIIVGPGRTVLAVGRGWGFFVGVFFVACVFLFFPPVSVEDPSKFDLTQKYSLRIKASSVLFPIHKQQLSLVKGRCRSHSALFFYCRNCFSKQVRYRGHFPALEALSSTMVSHCV